MAYLARRSSFRPLDCRRTRRCARSTPLSPPGRSRTTRRDGGSASRVSSRLMVDHVSPAVRSAIMRAVRTVDTGPELAVRRIVHKAGYRYRLHVRELPGRPDIVFPSRGKVVFVHGCFWHGHSGCCKSRLPKSRIEFWRQKVSLNRARDRARIRQLRAGAWKVLVVWQCQLKARDMVSRKIIRFLEG
jgi:DNA mismatch endonuclease (patch repair protein)